jgi:hypothetical protein
MKSHSIENRVLQPVLEDNDLLPKLLSTLDGLR